MRERYLEAVARVRGVVQFVARMPSIVEDWSWCLARASLDIKENVLENQRLVQDLREQPGIVRVIERIGSRVAVPEMFAPHVGEAVPTIEFWRSHVTNETLPNPWVTDDKDDQMFVQRTLGTEFAEELRIASEGGRSYEQEFARRSDEQLAKAIVDFDGFNPWIEAFPLGDKSADAIEWHKRRGDEIHRLERENPALSRWLKKVAGPVHLNPWSGGATNITRQMMSQSKARHRPHERSLRQSVSVRLTWRTPIHRQT